MHITAWAQSLHLDVSDTLNIWEKRPETLRRKDVGKSIVYCERYFVGNESRYYIEANGPDYRIWRRVGDKARALELYTSFRFWVWFIEAFDCRWTTQFITWLMHRIL